MTKKINNKKEKTSAKNDKRTAVSSQQLYPLNMLYLYITEGCNLCCRHCWIEPPHQAKGRSYPVLDFELFKSAVEQGKQLGLAGVKLTGGEPLMHPQISDILEYLRSSDIQLTIETNGVLCSAELAQKIAACKNSFASISLDGSDAATHEWVRGVEGSFDAALQGIRHLSAAGLKPQIIMSIMRRNIHQVEAVVRLAESLGAGSVKFNLIQPTARGKKMHDSGESLTIQEFVELGRWVDSDLTSRTHLHLYFDHPLAFRPLGNMFAANSNGCSRCGILGILGVLASGSYALCGIGETVPELIFGHISTNPLREVWNTNQILADIRKGLPGRLEGICGSCIMRNLCLGSCIAQNYYRSKELWAPFWYCQEAEKAGLFPKSRKKIV